MMPYSLDYPYADSVYVTVMVPEEEYITQTENQSAMYATIDAKKVEDKQVKENIDKKKSKKSGSGKKIYDYNYDADYIYAAFFEQYHIDLAEQELHWWKFSALFSALSEDCMISKIITYRVIDTKGMEKEQKAFYNRMKRLYQLPEDISEEERERQDKITQALLGDGDLTGIL